MQGAGVEVEALRLNKGNNERNTVPHLRLLLTLLIVSRLKQLEEGQESKMQEVLLRLTRRSLREDCRLLPLSARINQKVHEAIEDKNVRNNRILPTKNGN